MQKKIDNSKFVKVAALVLGGIVIGGLGGVVLTPSPIIEVPTAQENAEATVEKLGTLPTADDIIQLVPEVDTTITDTATAAYDTILRDDMFEAEAEVLATEEWEDRDYKDIYNAIDDIYGDIDEKEDIIYIKVKDTNYNDMDSKDKDGTIVQEVKVRYETEDGDNVNRYLTVTTEIEDGEVEDQEITETD